MTRALQVAAMAGLIVWWAPTFAVAIVHAAPHVVAGLSAPYRMRRIRRLIDRGDVNEADRVIAALRRDADATERWLGAVAPWGRAPAAATNPVDEAEPL